MKSETACTFWTSLLESFSLSLGLALWGRFASVWHPCANAGAALAFRRNVCYEDLELGLHATPGLCHAADHLGSRVGVAVVGHDHGRLEGLSVQAN